MLLTGTDGKYRVIDVGPSHPLLLTAATTSIGPYAAVMGLGFVIGVVGHVIRSRPMIIAGILMVGAVSVYVAFVVGKLGQ